MLVYLADLAHTYSTKNESLMVPLNIGYLKAYAVKYHKNNINIECANANTYLIINFIIDSNGI